MKSESRALLNEDRNIKNFQLTPVVLEIPTSIESFDKLFIHALDVERIETFFLNHEDNNKD